MFTHDQYALLDFGNGRKLERFGRYVLDRPAPAAAGFRPLDSRAWDTADARYQRAASRGGQGTWVARGRIPTAWDVYHGDVRFEVRRGDSGNVGIFPEQAENWDWITSQLARSSRPVRLLNLFAFTGGTTLAAAAAGAEVTHVDAARSAVKWGRYNAQLSQLNSSPIRWIAEDAVKFVRRELNRGQTYDALVLDPPSYGHGPKREAWKFAEHLPGLLKLCHQLLADQRAFVLLTCHSPGYGPAELEALLADTLFSHCQSGARARRLVLETSDRRRLPSGIAARWPP